MNKNIPKAFEFIGIFYMILALLSGFFGKSDVSTSMSMMSLGVSLMVFGRVLKIDNYNGSLKTNKKR
ncbi:MAG: hypothetical protein KAJ39_07740 [Gammaproteobacteria bacterium]|nr:hypothetical protein [Gammaproteobacteria bacterium]